MQWTLFSWVAELTSWTLFCEDWNDLASKVMCFEPLEIYVMSFWPFLTISDVFWCFYGFSMFAHLYLTYCYINRPSMHSPYYSIPIWCVTDLFRLCFNLIYLCRYQYFNVSIIYIFGWLYYYYRFVLQSLCTISSIWSLQRHFNLSGFIFTYT